MLLLHNPKARQGGGALEPVRARLQAGGLAVTVEPFAHLPEIARDITRLRHSADAVVVTVAGSSTALPGTEPGAVKVTPFAEYPAKGRATGGVRCHRFLKGEDALVFAWAGVAPARAAAASGAPVELPEANGRRDGSGIPGSQPIAACAGPLAERLPTGVEG